MVKDEEEYQEVSEMKEEETPIKIKSIKRVKKEKMIAVKIEA